MAIRASAATREASQPRDYARRDGAHSPRHAYHRPSRARTVETAPFQNLSGAFITCVKHNSITVATHNTDVSNMNYAVKGLFKC